MAVENPRETFRRLHAIANNDGATDSERENARRVMARYTAKYGDEVSIPATEPEIERDVKYDGTHENTLSIHCGLFTGVKSFDIGKRLYQGRKNETFRSDGKTTRYKGAESAVLAAVELYEHHREKLNELLRLTANGYRFAAMPLPETDGGKGNPCPDHLLPALRAAQRVGRTHSLTGTLTAKAGT